MFNIFGFLIQLFDEIVFDKTFRQISNKQLIYLLPQIRNIIHFRKETHTHLHIYRLFSINKFGKTQQYRIL